MKTYRIEDAGAVVVVGVGVEIIDTDSVDTKHLHEGRIAKAGALVRERVTGTGPVEARAATRLVGNADNLEAVASGLVGEVAALDLDGRHGGGQRCGADEA